MNGRRAGDRNYKAGWGLATPLGGGIIFDITSSTARDGHIPPLLLLQGTIVRDNVELHVVLEPASSPLHCTYYTSDGTRTHL